MENCAIGTLSSNFQKHWYNSSWCPSPSLTNVLFSRSYIYSAFLPMVVGLFESCPFGFVATCYL